MSRIDAAESSYDELPYIGKPQPGTHPDRLATALALAGVDPVDPECCRVLEIGCGDGSNLIPMAVALPGSEFVGFDLSRVHVDRANQTISDLALSNITVARQSLGDSTAELGRFDYIICHGVYSWVARPNQDAIMTLIQRHLEPNGAAYVSFNTNPGWKLRGIVRDMLRDSLVGTEVPREKVRLGRERLIAYRTALVAVGGQYAQSLIGELDQALESEEYYFFHEYLERHNEALYLSEFLERAQSAGLKHLGDSDLALMLPGIGAEPIEGAISSIAGETPGRRQAEDIIFNRHFSRTLLCRAELPLTLPVSPDVARQLWFRGDGSLVSSLPSFSEGVVEEFKGPDERVVAEGRPLVKAALVHLLEAQPQVMRFSELSCAAAEIIGLSADERIQQEPLLAAALLGVFSLSPSPLVRVAYCCDRFVESVSERPESCPLARYQVAGGKTARVTNRLHSRITLDDWHAAVMNRANGERTAEEIVQDVAQDLSGAPGENSVGGADAVAIARACLERIGRNGLLIR